MFPLLSIVCFIAVVWVVLDDPDFSGQTAKKNDEGSNTLGSALMGMLLAPVLLVGALLVFLPKFLGSVIPFLLFIVSFLIQALRKLCSVIRSFVGRTWRSLRPFVRSLTQSGFFFRAVRSLLRDVRAGFDTFAALVRAAIRAVGALLMQLPTGVRHALRKLFRWMYEVAMAGVRVTPRCTARRSPDAVGSFSTAARQTSARSQSASAHASSRSSRRHQTSRQWLAWLFPLAGWLVAASRTEEHKWLRTIPRREGSVHAVHGDRFARRKRHAARLYVGRIAEDGMKVQKASLREEDFMVLPRIRQIGWQTRGRAQHLS